MNSNFTPEQKAAVRKLVKVPSDTDKPFRTDLYCLDLAEVSQTLGLHPLPYREFLGPDCWLAGGQVLRWLCSAGSGVYKPQGDFDFYFRSLEDLNNTARAMLDQGFKLRGYRSFSKSLLEFLRYPAKNRVNEDWSSAIRDETGDLIRLTPELCRRLRLIFLELVSDQGHTIQLVTIFDLTPIETIRRFDFSVTQFAVNERKLFFCPWAWRDLLKNRFRVTEGLMWPDATFYRVIKYIRRGFHPYPKDILSVSVSAATWFVTNSSKYLLSCFRGKSFNR